MVFFCFYEINLSTYILLNALSNFIDNMLTSNTWLFTEEKILCFLFNSTLPMSLLPRYDTIGCRRQTMLLNLFRELGCLPLTGNEASRLIHDMLTPNLIPGAFFRSDGRVYEFFSIFLLFLYCIYDFFVFYLSIFRLFRKCKERYTSS